MGLPFISGRMGRGGTLASATGGGGDGFGNQFSVSLDASDDFISIPASADYDFGTSAFSYSMWFNISDPDGYASFIYRALNHRIKFQGTDKRLNFAIPGGELQIVNAASSLLNAWHHLVIARDTSDNTIKTYIDASQTTSLAVGVAVDFSSSGNDLLIGNHVNTYYLGGLIDEFSIFDSTLSASQVSDIYNSGEPTDIEGLDPVGWWRMGDGTEAGSGTTVYDMSSNSNNATLTNGPTFSTTVPS